MLNRIPVRIVLTDGKKIVSMREHAIVKYIHRDHTGYHGHHEFQVKMEHVERTNAATY